MQNQELLDLINSSKNILVTSHYSPDPDSIGATLFVYNLLRKNHKEVSAVIEGPIPQVFSFLEGFKDIQDELLLSMLKKLKPDLLIMLDCNNYKRISRLDSEKIAEFIKENNVRTMIIDHHLEDDKIDCDVFINSHCSSACEEVYRLLVKGLNFESDLRGKEAILLGIVGDTGRFLYSNLKHRDTFEIVSEILDAGLSIEELQLKLNTLTPHHATIIAELLKNLTQKDDYNYSFLSDEFMANLQNSNVSSDVYNIAYHLFMDEYLRSISPNKWGFVLIQDTTFPAGVYKGSFRAVNDLLDTTVFAKILGGGGHKPASGFKVKASTYEKALEMVHKVIAENKTEAYANK